MYYDPHELDTPEDVTDILDALDEDPEWLARVTSYIEQHECLPGIEPEAML